jgi:hypothetical protein
LLNVFLSAQRKKPPRAGTPIVRRAQEGAADTSKAATEAGKERVGIQPQSGMCARKDRLNAHFRRRSPLAINVLTLSFSAERTQRSAEKSGTFLDSGAMLPEHRARANSSKHGNSLMQQI